MQWAGFSFGGLFVNGLFVWRILSSIRIVCRCGLDASGDEKVSFSTAARYILPGIEPNGVAGSVATLANAWFPMATALNPLRNKELAR